MKLSSGLIDSTQEISVIRNTLRMRKSSAWWEIAENEWFLSADQLQIYKPLLHVDKHQQPVQTMIERWRPLNFPLFNPAAAHLAGFMGKELTSGRLPRYPSSVWKLIPSSVSKPRDPLAGGITWVSAVWVPPPSLWTSVSENLDINGVWDPDTLSLDTSPFSSSPSPHFSSSHTPHSVPSSLHVSISRVEVRAVSRSCVTLSAAVSSLLQTHDWPVSACWAENNFETFSCQKLHM